jgi:hypothetical protein
MSLDAMPIKARLKPAEVRQAFKLLSLDLLFVVTMVFRGADKGKALWRITIIQRTV